LLGILRNLGPDILLATHSTEIITEAEADEILLVNKERRSARRLRNLGDIEHLFELLGSNINPILTQLAKTRRVLFVEGKDFQILGRFAQKLGNRTVANRSDFAVVPVEGFNPERIRSLKHGMETTLGGEIMAGAIFDRDYRSVEECAAVRAECESFCQFVEVHTCKEIENFVLVPSAMDRALQRRLEDRARRGGASMEFVPVAQDALDAFAESKKAYVFSQLSSEARRFARTLSPSRHESEIVEPVYAAFEAAWTTFSGRISAIPGKDALSDFNRKAQDRFGVNVTTVAIVDAMTAGEVPSEVNRLIQNIHTFAQTRTP